MFPLVYFRFISNQNIFYGRYLLPLLPFLSLLGRRRGRRLVVDVHAPRGTPPARCGTSSTVALTLIAIAPPAYTSISYDANAAKVWTHGAGLRLDHRRELPPGTTITLEGSLAIKLPVDLQDELREAAAPATRSSDYAGSGIQYLVASSQCYGPYFGRTPADAIRRNTPTTSSIFAQTRGSRAVHAVATSIRARSCVILKVPDVAVKAALGAGGLGRSRSWRSPRSISRGREIARRSLLQRAARRDAVDR